MQSPFAQTQPQQLQTAQQQQQQALLQSLLGGQAGASRQQSRGAQQGGVSQQQQQQQGGTASRRRGRADGLPAGSRAAPASTGRQRSSRTAQPILFGQGNDAALRQLAANTARAPQAPVEQHIEGMRGRAISGFATGAPASPVGQEAIQSFLEQHADCQNLTLQSLMDFLNTVNATGYDLRDIQSVMRTLAEAGVLGQRGAVDLQRRSRWGGGAFAQEVMGVRGARGEVPLPSTLWLIASTYCDMLPTVTAGMRAVANGTLGTEALDQPLPAANTLVDAGELNNINAALAAFVATHPQCAPSEEELRWFLAYVDSLRFNGRDLFALVRAFGLEGYLRSLLNDSNARFAGGAFTPATTGVTAETFDRIKPALLWKIAENYCSSMGPLDAFIYNIVSGRAAQGLAVPEQAGMIGQLGTKAGGVGSAGTFGSAGRSMLR
ncbi:hypothetical protein pmac_cds_220 [Pandoravirus macleodensis]|uniref:Uncharacterized protein n=1 Tax=Pandoravirus macleodensis TaxID=2107707 RepID=A0A2U7UEL6_9VIRU|nr:hypothetical protein pmac_cds_220 [Pandoravirus macleodensis]AVK76908.1 hypothetical protein pmac_cds_220 [Pandoravirus macleodensis]